MLVRDSGAARNTNRLTSTTDAASAAASIQTRGRRSPSGHDIARCPNTTIVGTIVNCASMFDSSRMIHSFQ